VDRIRRDDNDTDALQWSVCRLNFTLHDNISNGGRIRYTIGSAARLRITVTTEMLMWDLPNFQLVRSIANTQQLEGISKRARISAAMMRINTTQPAKKCWKHR
jgi:hypothetical protein